MIFDLKQNNNVNRKIVLQSRQESRDSVAEGLHSKKCQSFLYIAG